MTKARRKRRAFVVSRVRCSGQSLAAHGSNHVVYIDKHPQAVLAQLPRDDGGRGDRLEQARPASLLEPAGGGFVVGLADGPLQAGITAAAVAGNGVGPGGAQAGGQGQRQQDTGRQEVKDMEADVVPPGWLPAGGFPALEQRGRCRYRRIRPGPDATWQLLALANYQASEQVFVSLGYPPPAAGLPRQGQAPGRGPVRAHAGADLALGSTGCPAPPLRA